MLPSHPDKSPVPSFEAQRRYWDERWRKHPAPNFFQSCRGAKLLELIGRLPLESPTILDYGCGTGWFAAELARIGHVVAVDLSEAAIEEAKRRYPGPLYLAANVFELTLPEEHFDLVVSQEVIAHVVDPSDYLNRITRMLKPRGYLALTTANKIVMNRLNDVRTPDAHIKRWMGWRDLRRLLVRDYEILEHTTIIPRGDRGFLRLVNSWKLHVLLKQFVDEDLIRRAKERLGWGYTIVVLARKREYRRAAEHESA